jgi:HlyD family secretion protein
VILLIVIAVAAGAVTLAGSGEHTIWRTAQITRGNIAEVVTATGSLAPLQLVNVGTQVSGQVEKVYVKVNDPVKKAQLLAEIDPSLLAAQVQQDEAALETARVNDEQAQRDLERNRMLLAKDYVAKQDLEHAQQAALTAKNAYAAAKTQLERDKVNLNYAKIYSPIDGVVIAQDITVGETVAASFQTPKIFKIAGDLTKMKIDVSLSESDVGKVKPGLPATFAVDAFPDRQFAGTVQTVKLDPNNQQGVVTYSVIVGVDNKDRLLLPGMTAFVSITLSERKNVLRVPAAALRFTPPPEPVSGIERLLHMGMMRPVAVAAPNTSGKDKQRMLYLLRGDALTPVSVTTGASDDTYVEVSGDGIAEGDTVVTGATRSL